LSNFDIKTYAFCGGKDTLVVPRDCYHLLSVLKNVEKSYFVSSYNHLDFIWAVNSKQKVYNKILQVLNDVN